MPRGEWWVWEPLFCVRLTHDLGSRYPSLDKVTRFPLLATFPGFAACPLASTYGAGLALLAMLGIMALIRE